MKCYVNFYIPWREQRLFGEIVFSSCLIHCSVSTDKVTTCFWQQALSIEKCTFVSDVIYALVASVIAQKGWSELLFLLEDKNHIYNSNGA